MVLWLIRLLFDHFDRQKKKLLLKLWGDVMDFIIKSEYSKYLICSFFLAYYTARAPIRFMTLFYGIHY